MKNTVIAVLFLMSLAAATAAQTQGDEPPPASAPPSWDFAAFGIEAPGNGYLFSWSPGLATPDYKISILTGYGQAYSDTNSFLDTLLYRGGLGFTAGSVFANLDYSKDFASLGYAYYAVQSGLEGRIGLKLDSGLTLQDYGFFGTFDNSDCSASSFWYSQASAYQSLDLSVDSDLAARIDLSLFRDPSTDRLAWGIQSDLLLSLFDNGLSSHLSMGHVEQGTTGIAGTMTYDFSAVAPGFPAGIVSGSSFVALENKARFFPLASFTSIPFISNMLYIGPFLDLGIYLPAQTLISRNRFSYMAGAGIGLLFFKTDFTVSYGYGPDSGWDLQFRMKSISLY